MKIDEMKAGDSLAGFIIDGNEHTPYVHPTLIMSAQWGPILQFSYPPQGMPLGFPQERQRSGQHSEINWWVEHPEDIPEVLRFQSAEGVATFYNSRLLSSKENWGWGINFTLRPETVIFGSFEPSYGAPLRLNKLKSTMTDLGEFVNMNAFNVSRETDAENRTKSLTATIQSPEPVSLDLDDCVVTFSLSWKSTITRGSELRIYAEAWFETEFPEGASADDHLAFHRQMRAILAINGGSDIWITGHRVRPPSASRDLPLVHDSTFADSAREASRKTNRVSGLISIADVDMPLLAKWLQDREYWHRVTGPILGILQRDSYAIEDRVIATGIAIETIGKKLQVVDGEVQTYQPGGTRKTFATWMYRCIEGSGLDFSDSGHSHMALARAFAQVYNKTKHYDQNHQPEAIVSHNLGRMALLVVRAIVIRSLLPDDGETELNANLERSRVSERLKDILIGENGWPAYLRVESDSEEAEH